jgi:uncharacterized protein
MSDAPSKKLLPRQVDPRKFATKGISLSGRVPLEALPRLSEAVQSGVDEIDVHLHFGIDEQGAKTLKGSADARVSVVCQRCLQPAQLTLHADIALAVIWTEEQAQNLSKDLDPWVLEEGPADIYQAVEEELLLVLPMVAYHEEQCIDPSVLSVGDVVPDAQESNNPFKVLEQLKGSPK